MNRNRVRAGAPRSGFTLVELLIVVTLLGLIGTMLTSVLVRQQRFHRAVASLTDARARMRDVATILPTDLRSMSTIGNDILAFTDTSLQFRAFIGTSVLCRYQSTTVIELPPRVLAPVAPTNSATTRSTVLTAWISPPAPNDIAFMYSDGTEAGNADDDWAVFAVGDTISDTDETWCPTSSTFTAAADDDARRYRITLGTAPVQEQVQVGAPIRFAREVRYSLYQASDAQWYVGFERCTPNIVAGAVVLGAPGTCGTREVLAGPVLPATGNSATSGLYFIYRNQTGGVVDPVANPGLSSTIASIEIGVRTTSESLRQAASTAIRTTIAGGDSLRFIVGIRNRI